MNNQQTYRIFNTYIINLFLIARKLIFSFIYNLGTTPNNKRKLAGNCIIITAFILFGMLVFVKIQGALNTPFAEVREMANIVAIESIKNKILNNIAYYPENIYLYGCLQAWVLSWLPEDINLIQANRIFSIISLLLSAFPILLIIKKLQPKTGALTLLIAACAYLYPNIVEFPLTLGTPNYLGLLFSNLVLYLSIRHDNMKIIFIPICLICCFLTKQYHLFSLCYPICALLFYKKERLAFLKFIIILILTGIGIYICMTHMQSQYAIQHHLLVRGGASKRLMVSKYLSYILLMLPILWLMFIAFLRQHLSTKLHIGRNPSKLEININLSQTKKSQFPIFDFIFCLSILCCSLLVMFRMGQHVGAIGIMYYAQLLTPTLVTFAIFYSSSIGIKKSDSVIACIFLALISLKTTWNELHTSRSYSNESNIVMNDLKDSNLNIRGSAVTSYMQNELNQKFQDNGLTQYTELTFPRHEDFRFSELRNKAQQYKNKLNSQIENQYYDVIYTDFASYIQPSKDSVLTKKYTCTHELEISQGWKVKRWVPKNKEIISKIAESD